MILEKNTAIPKPETESLCIACREVIKPGASICPACGSSQNRFHRFSDILKWIGGITAVLSLLILSTQVQELLGQWQRTDKAVITRIEGAKLQREVNDLLGAMRQLQEALKIDPTSGKAKAFEAELAMEYIRKIVAVDESPHPLRQYDLIKEDGLEQTLYQRAVSADVKQRATIMAHLGWFDILRFRSGVKGLDLELHFKRALELDPDNFYANLMWAAWIPSRYNPAQYDDQNGLARQHFEKALAVAGDKRRWVRELQLEAFTNWNIERLRIGLEMHRLGEFPDLYVYPIRPFTDIISQRHLQEPAWDELNEHFSPVELMEITDWLLTVLPAIKDEDSRHIQGQHREALYLARGKVLETEKPYLALDNYLLSQSVFFERLRCKECSLYAFGSFPDILASYIEPLASALNVQTMPGLVLYGGSPNSTARNAGMLNGDLILRINGKIIHSKEDLPDEQTPGELTAQVLRNGQILELTFPAEGHGIGTRPILVTSQFWDEPLDKSTLGQLYRKWINPHNGNKGAKQDQANL